MAGPGGRRAAARAARAGAHPQGRRRAGTHLGAVPVGAGARAQGGLVRGDRGGRPRPRPRPRRPALARPGRAGQARPQPGGTRPYVLALRAPQRAVPGRLTRPDLTCPDLPRPGPAARIRRGRRVAGPAAVRRRRAGG
ncbi:hypothetical protein SBRY_160035 [Actinacidiphila bryophytorum]|uniref:Uncharacterized protein n=1 Tax=Actinacidiphila bryophytorum TaxID=1436133 RepID=A0A9W4GXS2_9ACTN|nr:hypothetical protein SBRY_160035 [Actinacidiphila bryophytorum]